MAREPTFGLIVGFGPPWSRRKIILKKPSPWTGNREALRPAQIKACIALGEAAKAARGTRGLTLYKGISMPGVAVKVAMAVSKGEGAYGGKRMADRRTEQHAKADTSLDGLRSLLAKKGA